ncbi:alpha/beta hydrolase [Pontixanthobacter aestiaquae]|uniref:Alpha/beta fold hydrolase n=1 Tax=Pontixanthobacter aestiaquae TaxID=1509367 RepID=A0A844Z7P1_9SPHN|nr:alpha/beta hydrolase [Pontixanthobacter aestiaquae]MDN3645172.1 alpha/beta hydrolase [Pontixanthobacter aestiaquae]MXO83828.1 alpha/beta fold hydrolase [Pontixanthobacter aestiaquae]
MVPSFDDTELAVHRLGAGRPVLLLHGLFSNAEMNWIKFGHAQKLADAGFKVIMPDLRAHGESDAPHELEAYPDDVLAKDALALVDALGLDDFDLVGFSLGARTAARAVISGLKPRKLVLSGMGLEGLAGWGKRSAFFIDAIDRFDEVKRGDPAFMAVSFMKTMKVDRVAARLLLQSVADTQPDQLAALTMPTMVLCGDKDQDNGSAPKLAETLADATYVEIPGTHMSSVTEGALGDALVEFLSGPAEA